MFYWKLLERTVRSDEAKKPAVQLTPRSLVNLLQRKRDEVLRFMTDLSVPFDNNGSERDLRIIKPQHRITGCSLQDHSIWQSKT